MVQNLKFVADGMLGKVTRWLRMLGQDVEYHRNLNDDKLILIAAKENRVLLTRDLNLCSRAHKKGVNAFLVDAVKPSVVAIDTEVTINVFRRSFTQEGAGSGWIIDENGIVLTNSHVVAGAKIIIVTLDDFAIQVLIC